MNVKKFPEGFLWGVATASYQIEGSPLADGAGMSIWHTFSHTPGNVKNGDTGDVACDHYNRWKEDIEIIEKLGVKAYRFSISWPRILPEGTGRVNQKGLDFYNRIIDTLLEKGITPFVTIYHWDLPFALQLKGGWANREIADWFAEYSRVLFENFGDRVKNWITLNEPWVVAIVGHLYGVHAPGMRDIYVAFRAVHNLLRAHAKAVKVFRETVKDGKIGIVFNNGYFEPASEKEEDIRAARFMHQFNNYPLFLNPIYRGDYPELVLEFAREYLPENYKDDMSEIQEKIDFVGLNYYSGHLVKFDPDAPAKVSFVERDLPKTAMGWEIVPEGIYWILKKVKEEYNPPEVYITENGAAFDDVVSEDGRVHDQNRIDYLKAHIGQAWKAIQEGVPLKGYFVWSLLDNFEWAEGYSKRFGIVYVDYSTQKRIIKDSGYWYSNVVKSNSLED
ncbi:beta-galactosidase [Thermotoga petrophila RKU-10]|jgi:beta-glucosidase|uniref:Beta-glucosidase n=3 Tax=Thermotoga petrophila TaxID=93929 RepID=A5IL97_THEP1